MKQEKLELDDYKLTAEVATRLLEMMTFEHHFVGKIRKDTLEKVDEFLKINSEKLLNGT